MTDTNVVIALLVMLCVAGAILLGAYWTYIWGPNCAVRKVTDDYAKWKAENDLRREARVAARNLCSGEHVLIRRLETKAPNVKETT